MSSNAAANAVRIVAVEPFFSLETPAGEFSFGAATAGALTLAHVRVRVADTAGREADGWGAIFLSHPWAFPTNDVDPAAKDALMRAIVVAIGERLVEKGETGHPLDHFLGIEPEMGAIAQSVAAEQEIDVPVPALCTLVCFSPIDAAVHDAYGRFHDISAFDALGPDYVGWDLSRVLGEAFSARYLTDYLRTEPVARVPVWHTVGGTDPLTVEEADDAHIRPLSEWIAQNGLFAFKIKLKGQDLNWDIARLVDVHDLARRLSDDPKCIRLFGDLNEQGPSLDYVLALIDGVRERSPDAYAALEALEQPDRRDMGDDAMAMSAVAARIPIALDEGLTSLASIDRAVELGWSAVCLKTCKTQSLMLLALAKATGLGLGVTMQDLTNPGIALLHAVAFAARLPVTMPIETNQRQYYPATSTPEAAIYPEVFTVQDGYVRASSLTNVGLGYDIGQIDREIFRTEKRGRS